ncbi:MAG TPA: VOC family protein [Methylomirabilota bacterium]|nr:VOC family protein [Methylomirabilota bacterium]
MPLAPPQRLHHVAYLTRDTQKTVDFYTKCLNMKLVASVQNENVPSTGEKYPHLHTFFQMADGGCVAFFEIIGLPRDEDRTVVPGWVRHLALRVPDRGTLLRYKEHLVGQGVEVLGPVDHDFCHSIYFFDPNGLRLELTSDVRGFGEADAVEATEAVQAWNARAGRPVTATR